MTTINDYKVKDEDFNDLDIMSLPSRPSAAGMSAAQLQERFDAGSKQVIMPKFNQLIDLLNGTEGADNIGIAPIEGLSGYTVQQILFAIKMLLDDKKNAEQSDREIAQKFDTSEAQALVKEVTFSEGSGVFTITKYDGSVQTYDTALEKVALDVRLDGQQFVLTLADGSEQRVDLSAFITQTEVKSSDTITLAIENGAIVARITSGSVMLSHLNAEVTAYIDEKEAAAANSAAAAKLSEQNALNSANTAKASEQAAKACQEQACSCATQAGLSRDAAKASEQAAKEAADRAVEAAGGDFVTNTAFNQFKETVPTLDDGKVSVQQGGLYINSETTEEDKAEAQEALKEIGGFLPLDGSVPMSGAELWLNDKAGRILSNTELFRVDVFNTENDLSNRRAIWLGSSATSNAAPSVASAVRLFDVVNGTRKVYNIFGEHNKPSGSYTGNGSATQREIAVGGINDNVRAVIITSLNGITFVTSGSAVAIGTGGAKKISNVWMGSDMNLNIATTDELVNANGVDYYYHSF